VPAAPAGRVPVPAAPAGRVPVPAAPAGPVPGPAATAGPVPGPALGRRKGGRPRSLNKRNVHCAIFLTQAEHDLLKASVTRTMRQTGKPVALSEIGRNLLLAWARDGAVPPPGTDGAAEAPEPGKEPRSGV
ncbi:MAG: hypothetical protein LBT40_07490, partial [Deltaproteobacteria bacterium]|jgi:hypothetical protein|nr:hypothetical protein [Deltaproteobacteria bacterium]